MNKTNSLNIVGGKLTFDKIDFTTNYFDKENDLPFEITIFNDMIYGVLIYNNKIIKAPFIFNIINVDKLEYVRISPEAYTELIQFKISDNNLNKLYSDMATMTISVNAYNNLPPDSVGDNELIIDYGDLVIFTSEDFTSNTTPPYDDPEGDAPYKLKVLTLPPSGNKLQLNGTDCIVNQEILFTDIAEGKLTMVTSTVTTGGDYSFNFAVSDVGSQQFSS